MNTPDTNSWQFLGSLSAIGFAVGVFQVLASGEKVTVWRAVGRAGVTAGIALGAAAALAIIPGLGMAAIVGLAAACASIGTSALEKVLARVTGTKESE